MKRLVRVYAPLLFLLAAGTQARAGNIDWTYNWDRSPAAVLAGTGGVSFTNEPTKAATNSSDIVATNLKVFSTASPTSPDQIGTGGGYTLTLTLTDTASGQSHIFMWKGQLTGSFSQSSANVANTLHPDASAPPLTQTFVLGNNTYTVTIGPYSPPGPPSASNSGSIAAHVDITPGGVITGKMPEPSTMLLSFVGLSVFGGAAWRRRRAALAV
jgi:hypothetical protein